MQLSISVGMGANKLIAAVATKQAKPGKQVRVPIGEEQPYLAPWPVRVLPGAGPQAAGRLDRLNVHQVGEVATVPVPVLAALFGARGRVLHEQAHGIDPRPVQATKTAAIRQPAHQLRPADRRPRFPAGHARLSARPGHHLAALPQSCHARTGVDHPLRRLRKRPGPSFLSTVHRPARGTASAARDRFERLYQRRLPLRLLGVELSPVVPPDPQPALFVDPEIERDRRLAACKDAIRQRFGFTALLDGSALVLAQHLDRDRENFQLRTPCLTR